MKIFLLIMFVFAPSYAYSQSQIVRADSIEYVCDELRAKTIRNTFIYVDLSAIDGENLDWGLTILNKLSLSQREPVSIYSIDPYTNTIEPIYEGCFPALTSEELTEAETNRSFIEQILSFSPEEQQKENLEIFDSRLRSKLGEMLTRANDLDSAKERRSILEALALDKARLSSSKGANRVIVYTKNVPIPNMESAPQPIILQEMVESYWNRFQLQAKGSEFYFFGIDGSEADGTSIEAPFIGAFLQLSEANLVSFGPALPPQESSKLANALRYEGTYSAGTARGRAEMTVLTDEESQVQRAYILLQALDKRFWVLVDVHGNCSEALCAISGQVAQNVPLASDLPYFRRGDELLLSSTGDQLAGSIRASGNEVFSGTRIAVEYSFSMERIGQGK